MLASVFIFPSGSDSSPKQSFSVQLALARSNLHSLILRSRVHVGRRNALQLLKLQYQCVELFSPLLTPLLSDYGSANYCNSTYKYEFYHGNVMWYSYGIGARFDTIACTTRVTTHSERAE